MVYKGGRGVEKVQKSVYVVYEQPLIKISLQKIVIAISISLLCCHFNSTESLQLIYNEGRQGLSDVRGKAHEHKKVGVIEKFFS